MRFFEFYKKKSILKTVKMLNSFRKKVTKITLFSFVLVYVFTFSSGFIEADYKNSVEEKTSTVNTCDNPLNNALEYNAFVRYETHLKNGDTEGPIAMGGDLTMKGIITVAAHTAGINYFNGDSEASSLVVAGKIMYNSGEGIHLNKGFVKIGDSNGSSVFDRDLNNASVNTRLTSGGYEAIPRVQVQRKQLATSVGHSDLIDFETAFEGFESTSLAFSLLDATLEVDQNNKINLTSGQVNVLNLTGNKILNMPYLTFENEPDASTPLIINVDASGDFEWNVFNINSIGDQHGSFIIWNFFNASSVTLKGGGTLVGSLFAPKADVIKDSSGNINGQVIAKNYYHNQGELHQHAFKACIDTPSTVCELSVNAGDDTEICRGQRVTLTASISDASICDDCESYSIENTVRCGKGNRYVLWLKDEINNTIKRFSNVDLEWKELANGIATLTGTVVDNDDPLITLEVDVIYSGKTITAPAGSPKNHFCNSESTSGWIYYTDVSGSVTQTDGSWSFDISRRGPAFQLGNGANITEEEVGKYGGSGWFDTTDSNFNVGDFNINIGECSSTGNSDVSYLWSTGATTPSIVVTGPGTYTVTVKDCEDCEASDTVEVRTGNPPSVTAGEDQQICAGQEVTLTAEVDKNGDCSTPDGIAYLWSTGETTKSITVSPEEDTEYTVTVNDCRSCGGATDKVLVSVSSELSIDLGEDLITCFGLPVVLTSPIDADTYLWSTGETTKSITVTILEPSSYTLEVSKDGCVAKDEIGISIFPCEGGVLPGSKTVEVYPTVLEPTGNVSLNMKSKTNQEVRISIHNLSGAAVGPVIVRNMPQGDETIDVSLTQFSKLSSGMYIMKITGETGTTTQRLIIQ